MWGRPTLAATIARIATEGRHFFLCGIAVDQFELLDLIDLVFLLSMDEETQRRRLDTEANVGRDAAERAQILDGLPTLERRMRAVGANILDARQPTTVLVTRILDVVGKQFP